MRESHFSFFLKRVIISITVLLLTRFLLDCNWGFSFEAAFFAPFVNDLLDFVLSLMDGIPLSVGERGASSSAEPRLPDLNSPTPEEDPGGRSEIERKLDQIEWGKVQDQKDLLAEQISPLIEEEKTKLKRKFWYRDLGELPSPNEMVEIILNRFGSESARNANNPNAPRSNLRHLKAWLTRALQSAKEDGGGNMSIQNSISHIIEESFK